MPRYFFEVRYAGTHYSGWQNQANAIGVQSVIEDALTKILRTKTSITGSGRTDTGVHCAQQFFHVDIEQSLDREKFIGKINSFLPRDIAIRSIRLVRPDAHARYDARERTYQYTLTLKKDPLLEGFALHYFKKLNLDDMNKACPLLLGEHDFQCFSKVKTDVNHFLCTVTKAQWDASGDLLIFTVSANRFLRGMVRAIVGTLLDLGTGKISLTEFKGILNSHDRRKAGANVDPHALSLTKVKYPSSVFLD